MRYKFFYICVLLLYFSISSFAQDKPIWITSFENILKQKEVDWKIDGAGGFTSQNGMYDYLFILSSGEFQTRIKIQGMPNIPSRRENAAEEAFANRAASFSKNIGKNVEKVKLANYGDEGFIWTDVKIDNLTVTWIMFRKQDVFVHVSASSEDMARKFG